MFIILLTACSKKDFTYQPTHGYVPDENTALKVAEALWFPVYGDLIYESTPFVARQQGDTWIVTGTLHTEFGGVPYIEISKVDCRVLKMYHGK